MSWHNQSKNFTEEHRRDAAPIKVIEMVFGRKKKLAPLRSLAALAILSAWLIGAVASTDAVGEERLSCRERQLKQAQQDVLAMLGEGTTVDLTSLDGAADLAALAGLGYDFYDHQMVSFERMGWPVVGPLVKQTGGQPFVLLYAPTVPDIIGTVTDPRDGFDFPYELAGWAYSPEGRYDFGEDPRPIEGLDCVERAEWFVHERGIHPFEDGGMRPFPPPEEIDGRTPHGTSYGEDTRPREAGPGDLPHPRIWDLHVWLDGDEVPTVSILSPVDIPGIDPDVDISPPPEWPDPPYPAFYYPPRVADLSVDQVDEPDPARVWQEVRYIITVRNGGPDRATRVTLTVELSKHAHGLVTPSQGSCTKTRTTVTCELGDLATSPYASIEIELVLRPTTKEPLKSMASVAANEKDLKGTTIDQGTPGDSLDDALLWTDGTADNTDEESTAVS